MTDYYEIAHSPAILDLQEQKGSRGLYTEATGTGPAGLHHLEPAEIELLTTRDSFYVATVNESGWPYVQHRGGERGFVQVIDSHTIGWVERKGNRQYLGTGNMTANGRFAAIFVDYPSRTRLKLYGTASYHPEPSAELLTTLDAGELRSDGAIIVEVLATAWNCPKYLTPRYTEDEVNGAIEVLQTRIVELEARLADM